MCKSSKAITTEAAQYRAADSLKGVDSMEDKGQARRVFSSIPAYMRSAKVHKTCGTQTEELIPLIKSLSFKTCDSFPSLFTFGLENFFKVSTFSARKIISCRKLVRKNKIKHTLFFLPIDVGKGNQDTKRNKLENFQ